MKNLLYSYSLMQSYKNHIEKYFYIHIIGYNDFAVIEPIKRPRTQNIYTLHFVLQGSGTLIADGKEHRIKKHDIFYLPPDVSFCYYPDENDKWAYLWFDFGGTNSTMYAKSMGFGDGVYTKACDNGADFYYQAIRILTVMDKKQTVGYYDTLSLFYKLIAMNSEHTKKDELDYVDIALAYVKIHYYDPELSVEKICRDIGISHSHFCRLFKKKTGITLRHHIINIRITEATRLLKTTDLSIKEVACAVGFNDYPHFVKTFKSQKDIPPNEYRKISL